ncbi:hypothetical protein DFW101_3729 (plasmid) [Solidesulfovibrio carbinoliphilus subsp. oakridgensis]|uniref:Hemolysin-type calcium-binding region n=1 Tax=Solidesulfovibrio carbinoliphilus subsp. oakridgensis TaxID=694327 RepID=G7QEB9_9BACT|nr:hypothetical protein [Solidesulfovibrio carbinoliphilus]EHJ46013.1 hypothetical protein DFW101_3729 [Solidesulfovibrio carbinoliphilus subsp. oakridgensis]
MASSWFDDSYYLSAKAAYNNAHAINGLTTWTVTSVQASLNAAGMTAEQHYSQYGWTEGLSPNAYYVESQYVTSKVAALNAAAVNGKTDWTSADFYASLNGANPFMHYVQYGAYEDGVEPSTGFDDDTYYADKAIYNNANAVGGITTWTADTVKAAFQANGLTPIGHYELYGATEAFYTPTPNPVTGQTFTLTTGVDIMTGASAGNNVFNGVVDTAANGGTLTPGDTLSGGSSLNNTANFVITTAGKWTAAATLDGIQTINFRNTVAGGDTLDTSNITGATAFYTSSSIGDLKLDSIQSDATLGVKNTTKTLTANFKDGTVTAGETVSLDLSAAGTKVGSTITRSKITVGHDAAAGTATDLTLGINATNANYITYDDGANSTGTFKTLTVTGQGSVDIAPNGTEFDNLTSVNASKNTGGLTIGLGANAKDLTIVGGSGNDSFDLTGGTFNGTDSVDGGTGTDTLSIKLGDAAAFTKAAPVTSIETLGLKLGGALAANTAVNASYFGISNIKILDAFTGAGAGMDTLTLNNLTDGTNVTFDASSAAAGTIVVDVTGAVAGTSNSATLTFGKGVDYNTSAVNVSATGVETVTLATSTTAGAGAELSALTDAALTTLNITGSDGITVATAFGASNAVTTVNASGVVKDSTGTVGGVSITMTGNTKAVTFTGGQGADTYVASAKGDTVTGGEGADIITLAAGNDILVYNAANESTATAKDVVGSFVTTADVIQFNSSLLVGTASWNGAAAFTATGHTQLNMSGADLQIDYNGDTVIDSVITLTGVTSATFGSSNFTFA